MGAVCTHLLLLDELLLLGEHDRQLRLRLEALELAQIGRHHRLRCLELRYLGLDVGVLDGLAFGAGRSELVLLGAGRARRRGCNGQRRGGSIGGAP